MKNIHYLFVAIMFMFFSCAVKSDKESTEDNSHTVQTPVVVAYVTSWSDIIPDPNFVTHINYAFGHVSETFNGVVIDQENRLRKIVDLKKSHSELKVLLSVGGWGSGRFSEMAADSNLRKSFAQDCKRVVDQFKLDGIDIDWEYPTSKEANISASPEDTDNYTLLMKEIREVIGDDKLLTLASAASGEYYDFKAIDKYIDFVNIMTYDMGRPPFHNAPLTKSKHTKNISVKESVDAHVSAGMPLDKLTLGLPFYGHGTKGIKDFVDYKDIPSLKGYTEKWDTLAQVPYLVDSEGDFVYSYDDARSLTLKCEYLLQKGMLGAMYWEYNGDDTDGTLRKVVYNTVMKK